MEQSEQVDEKTFIKHSFHNIGAEQSWMDGSQNKEYRLVVKHEIVQILQFHVCLTKNLHFTRLADCCFVDFKNAAMQEILNTNAIKINH